jgi:hypothetical protein
MSTSRGGGLGPSLARRTGGEMGLGFEPGLERLAGKMLK